MSSFKMPGKNCFGLHRQVMMREYDTRSISYDLPVLRMKKSWEAEEVHGFPEFWENPVFASEFCPITAYQDTLAAANETGQVLLWNIEHDNNTNIPAIFVCHDNAIFDLTWSHKEPKLVTVSGDKSVVLWDCDKIFQNLHTFTGHNDTVKCCAWNPASSDMFASGDRGGMVRIWDMRTNKAENIIHRAHERERHRQYMTRRQGKKAASLGTSITGMTFYKENYVLTSASIDSCIHMWDLRKYYSACTNKPVPVQEFGQNKYSDKAGYAFLLLDPTSERLYATTVNDRIFSFAMNTSSVTTVAIFVGARIKSFFAKSALSADGNYLLSGSRFQSGLVWNTNESLGREVLPLRCLGPQNWELNTAAWCRNPLNRLKVVVFPEGEPHEIWEINPNAVSEDEWESSTGSEFVWPTLESEEENDNPNVSRHLRIRPCFSN